MSLFEYMNQDQTPKMGLSQLIDGYVKNGLAQRFSSENSPPIMMAQMRQEMPNSTGEVIGTTSEGRPQVANDDGSISTERTITIDIGGKWYNIPTMYGGKIVPDDRAREIAISNGLVDPETGRAFNAFPTVDDAVSAAQQRSNGLGNDQGSSIIDEINDVYVDGGFPALLSYYGPKVKEGISGAYDYATNPENSQEVTSNVFETVLGVDPTAPDMADAGLAALFAGMTAGRGGKAAKGIAKALGGKRKAADTINDKFADEVAMRDLERRVYDLTSVEDFIDYGQQTGNKVSTPFQVSGPKMTVKEIQDMESARKFTPADDGYYDPKTFNPEDFEIDSLIVPNPGDPTVGGSLIQSLSGKSNVTNTSGTDFMRQMPGRDGKSPIWASGDNVMNKQQERGLEAGDNPVYFVSNEQGPKSVPFNSVVAQRYEELLDPSSISAKGAKEINISLERRVKNAETGELAPIKSWQKNIPAANTPEFAKWLHNLPGTIKSEVILRLNTGKAIGEGAPDVREIIHSFIGRDNAWSIDKGKMQSDLSSNKLVSGLKNDPLVGKSIARVDSGVPLRPSANPSFPTETTGEYVGGFGFRPTRSQVWRDWYDKGGFANRAPNAGHRAFTLSYPVQKVDREWQDTLMKLREAAIRQK